MGPDRIADTDQFSFGVTTRLIDAADGRERLTATLGQTRYLNAQRVTLPGALPNDGDASDYVAEMSIGSGHLGISTSGYQWNNETSSTARAETRLEFRPKDDRLFGFGYRYRRGFTRARRRVAGLARRGAWRIIGRYSYSFLDKERARGLRRLGIRGVLLAAADGQPQLREPAHRRERQLDLDSARAEGLVARRVTAPDDLLDRGILGYRKHRPSLYARRARVTS